MMRKKILSFYGVALLLGVLTGILSSLFQLAISALHGQLTQAYRYATMQDWPVGLISAFVSMLMVLVAYLMVKKIAPEASGSGVQEIEGSLLHVRPIFWRRLLPIKFMGGVLAISANMVLGREGPTIQMGGNLGEMLGSSLKFPHKRRDALIAAGSAAGLAAAFNAPLAGVLFVLEEMRNQFNFSFINFKTVAICCVASTIITHLIIGAQPAIAMPLFVLPSVSSLWLFFIFGIAVGFAGLIFNRVLMMSLFKIDKLSTTQRYGYVVMVSLLVGYLAFVNPVLVGGGYEIIEKSLSMNPSFEIVLWLMLVRFIMTMLSYGTGVPGGIFAPILALGTLLGLAASHIFQWLGIDMAVYPGMFAVAGMGALFSAAVRAPITGIVLVVEMTNNYSLILPLMVTCLTSTTVMQLAGNPPLYTQLLRRSMSLITNVYVRRQV